MHRLRILGASRFVVPPAVFDEVAHYADRAARALVEARWLERGAAVEVPPSVIEWDLGPGESAVIATCLVLGQARPVLDDLAGRRCARASGLRVIGTVGVVVAAHRAGHVDDPRKTLLELRAAGMWLSDTVIDQALSAASRGKPVD